LFNNKNVLVTGGAGFVGVNLIKRLIGLSANVHATLHKKEAVITESVSYTKCNLMNQDDCDKICTNMDYVFLCAANTSGAAVMENTPLAHLTPNIIMNVLMLEAAQKAGVKKLLFISSNTVYPLTDFAVKETDVTNEFYEKYFIVAWMKRFTEIVCDMYSTKIKDAIPAIVVRPANIYGPHDDFEWETSHVLPALMRKVIERQDPLEVWGDGKDIKDFIYIDDFITGILLAMEKINTFDPINIGSGIKSTIRDSLKIMLRVEKYEDANVVFNADKPSMIPKRMIDVTKAEKDLGFKAKTTLKEGLKKTMDWYKTQ